MRRLVLGTFLALLGAGAGLCWAGGSLGYLGSFRQWSRVEVDLTGPMSVGSSETQNPFLIDVAVTFSGPGGTSFTVPAFYDGDGVGGLDGSIWKVRFSPPALGSWSLSSSSSNPLLHDWTGTFSIVSPLPDAPVFERWGTLRYAGGHYLKFTDGPFWIKGGADDPEDFLGEGVMGTWQEKMAAVDYLAGRGVNSMYIMLQNVYGDGDNVWPWLDRTDSDHFDLAKLDQWEELFDHIQSRGIVLHFVLEDDSGWTGFNRPLYYREMIARFGHYNGLYWNISEEFNENYSASEVIGFAQQISDLDAYDHPVTVHHAGGLLAWAPFLGDDRFDLTSFQTNKTTQNAATIDWREESTNNGRPLTISFDETGKISAADRELGRQIMWSIYMGGGIFELHTWPIDSFQQFDAHWGDMFRARSFIQSLPFPDMTPENSLLSGGSGHRYCLYKAGEAYAVYLEEGGVVSLDLSAESGLFTVEWLDPRSGAWHPGPQLQGGAVRSLGPPPFSGEAAAKVTRSLVFRDGFETGDGSRWSLQSSEPSGG